MQRKLFAIALTVVMLVTSVGAAFAQAPEIPNYEPQGWPEYEWMPWERSIDPFNPGLWDCEWWWEGTPVPYGGFDSPNWSWIPRDRKLGDIVAMEFPVSNPSGVPATFWPIDIYLWRPPTLVWCYGRDAADPVGSEGWELFRYWSLLDNPQKVFNRFGSVVWGGDQTVWANPAWYLPIGANPDGPRRQSWPAYQTTDSWGFYYARFMLPRDEVWYPCGYPCKWNCSGYYPWTDQWEFHSPYTLNDRYPPAVPYTPEWYYPLYFPLYWPYKFWTDGVFSAWVGDFDEFTLRDTPDYDESIPYRQYVAVYDPVDDATYLWYVVLPSVTDPQDTTHPLTMWAVEGEFGTYVNLFTVDPTDFTTPWQEYEIEGYDWKTSDLTGAPWPQDWPMLCDDHNWYPTWLP